VCGLLNLRYR